MTQKTDKDIPTQPALCLKCNIMYGNAIFDNMCSQCYKKQKSVLQIKKITDNIKVQVIEKKQQVKTQKQQEFPLKRTLTQAQQKIIGKCQVCKKKTGLLGYKCKHCNADYCKFHRLPQDHQCAVDFIAQGKKKLKLQNQYVGGNKIQKI